MNFRHKLMRPRALYRIGCPNEQNPSKGITRLLIWILTLLVLSISAPAQEGDSCTLPVVKVGFTASMCSHNPYTISLNGTQVTGTGDCTAEQWVTSALTYANLKVDETYTLTVGSDSCSTHINFVVPEGYKLEIDGIEAQSIDKVGTTEGGGDGSWKVVLRQKCPCESEEPGESPGPKGGSVLWQVGMGSLSNGTTAHSINLREEALSAVVYTPAALVYSPPGGTNEVDVVRNGDQSLRQVKAPQALADIIVISATEYEVQYYRAADVGSKVDGLYTVTGQPFVKWKIKNPDPATTTRLQISKIQGAVTDTSEYTWDAISDSWTLSTGNGARIETSTITYPTSTSRVETLVVKDSALLLVSKLSRTYHTFAWGEEVIQEVLDPDGAALKTVYSFYEDQSEIGRYSRRKSIVNPDGSWEKYDYDSGGNLVLVMRPWKDQSIATAVEDNSHATRYTYSNSDGITTSLYTNLLATITEKIAGIIVAKRIYSRTGTTVQGHPAVVERETAYSSLIESLITTSTYYHATAPASLANRLISTEYPDGRKDSVSYEKGNYLPNADPALSQFVPDENGLAEREITVHGTTMSLEGIAFKTTKEVTVRDQYGNQVSQETYVYNGANYERIAWSVMDYDSRGHLTMSRNQQGEMTTAVWNGELKISEIDETGSETSYTYDSLNRIRTETKRGIAAGAGFSAQNDIITTFSYNAEGQQIGETISGGSLNLTTSRIYDKAGRIIQETDQAGLSTIYTYSNGGRTQTVTLPGGVTHITDDYLDGRMRSITGTAVVARYRDYEVNADGTQSSREFVGSAGLTSPRWTKTTTDWIGRTVLVEKPTFTGTNVIQSFMYNGLGQLQKRTVTSNAIKLRADTLYEYNELGQQIRSGADIDNSGTLTPLSTDRLTETDGIYEKVGNDWFRVTSMRRYLTDNDNTPLIQTQRERLNNFPLNGTEQTVSEVTLTDVVGNNTKTITTIDRAAKKQTTTTDTPDSTLDARSINVNGLLQSANPSTPQAATTYIYDSLGRQIGVSDPRRGASSSVYSAMTGQLLSITEGESTTSYEYYDPKHVSAGRLKSQTNVVGRKIYFNYNTRGELIQTWGEATYPLEYVYDAYGQRTELHTFRAGQNWSASVWPASTTGTADVTKWIYHESTGLLAQKLNAALKGATYTYDELSRIKTRGWARGITSTYGYDGNTGELRTITYSESTPAVSFTYDRGGRQSNITDAAGSHTRSFNVAGDLQNEQIAGGILDSVGITVGYDSLLRRNSLQTTQGANVLSSQTYGYDSTSRLETISSNSQIATYAYYPNSGLLNTTTFNGGTTIARSYDSLGRLGNISTTSAAGPVQSYAYTYNSLNQRTRLTREDGSYWSYIYNDRGELVSGQKYWSDNSIVWGAQTDYKFDNIGNRIYSRNGGNQLGTLRESTYIVNSLNQYSQRVVPGNIDIMGTANGAATVTVNNQAAARKGDYFYKELAVDNSTTSNYPQINVVGSRSNFGAGGEDAVIEKGGRIFVPRAVETYIYDDDGNLTSDGRWNYTWDGENRLVRIEALPDLPAEAKSRLEFDYDYMGRRIQKRFYTWNSQSATYQLQATTKFVYDLWNLIAELDANDVLLRSYVWGQDTSGTLHGMSGIGGLLIVKEAGATHFVGYDGNENITNLTAGNGSVTASYEYGPFGEALKVIGTYPGTSSFTFSTKYRDSETDFVYFGHRYYGPQLGRWINEDPVEERGRKLLAMIQQSEEGTNNPYSYVENKSLDALDATGLFGKIIYQNRHLEFELVGTAQQLAADHVLLRLPTSFDLLVTGKLQLASRLTHMLEDRTIATMKYSPIRTGKPVKAGVTLRGFRIGLDERGHIIGRQLGGAGEPYNLFPQSRILNHSASFRGFEDSIRQYQDSHKCCSARIEVYLFYLPFQRRPFGMVYDVRFYNLGEARLLKKFIKPFINLP